MKWYGDNKSLTKQTDSSNILMFMVIHVTKLGSYGTLSQSFERSETDSYEWLAFWEMINLKWNCYKKQNF